MEAGSAIDLPGLRFGEAAKTCALVLLLAVAPFATGFAATISGEEVFSGRDLKEDLRIAKSALEEGDPGFRRFAGEAALDDAFSRAEARLNRSMTALEFFRIVAPAIAAIGNGHTQIDLGDTLTRQLASQPLSLPLDVRVVNGRIFILRDLSGAKRTDAGAEVQAINGIPATTLVRDMEDALSEDGARLSSKEHDAGGLGFARGLLRIMAVKPPFRVALLRAGRSAFRTYSGISEREFASRAVHGRRGPTGLTFPKPDVAVMRIAHWDSEGPNGLSALFARWFRTLADRKTGSLIIDVRDNGGGEETMGTELLSYLVDAPFRYYECAVLNATRFDFLRYVEDDGTPYAKLLPQYARAAEGPCRRFGAYELANRPNLGWQKPRAPRFRGNVYLLINAGSFSTSAEFAATLHNSTQAVIVGQESSGNYYGNDSGITIPIVLPHSHLVLQVPTVAYYLAVRKDLPPRSGVIPGMMVPVSFQDMVEGADPEMDAALRLAAKRRP